MKKMMPVLILVMIITIAGVVYLFEGVQMQNKVTIEEQNFNNLQAEYWIVNKTDRDAAITGSELNQQLVRLKQYPSQLLALKLVGIGKILTGIFALLFVIGVFLFMMPFRIKEILNLLHKETKGS